MQKILGRRILRELKSNGFRYGALGLLIVLGMYIVISIVGAADTITAGVDELAVEYNLEDGEFSVFVPLSKEQKQEIKEQGVSLEEKFSIDFSSEDNSVIRFFRNRKDINRIILEEGRLAKNSGEAVLEKRYCEEHHITTGNSIRFGNITLKVTGIGTVSDYDGLYQKFTDSSADSSSFGLAFVTKEQYGTMKETLESVNSEEITYAYRLNGSMTDKDLKEMIKDFPFRAEEKVPNLTQFVTASENPRIRASAEDQVINKNAGLIVGVIVMILFTYVISVFVVHGIEKESSVIGTLYAMGMKKGNLMIHYLTLPVIITFVAGVIGTLSGFSRFGIENQMKECYGYFSIPRLIPAHPAYLICYGIAMPPAAAALVNCLIINRKLSQPALRLIRGEQRNGKIRDIGLGNMGFFNRFRIRQMIREGRSAFTVVSGMLISLMLLMMGLNCYIMCKNISVKNRADTRYEYMYTYKYPDKNVIKGGEPCYAKSLSKAVFGNHMEITLLGIDKDNPYFLADIKDGMNQIVLSSAAAQKYNKSAGDQIILTDSGEDRDYAFTVSLVTPYSVGLYAFMNIEDMRQLFGQEEDYYNVVFSDHALSIEPEKLYGVTSRADIEKGSDIFIRMMEPLVNMLCSVSLLVFGIVMYLMMKVMIDRSAFHISLIRIFGYRDREIKKLYLDGNFYIIALGALVSIPLAKVIVNHLYPIMLSNVAAGMDLAFPWQMYAGIYGAVILLYTVINRLLMVHLKKITPAEVLKNRE